MPFHVVTTMMASNSEQSAGFVDSSMLHAYLLPIIFFFNVLVSLVNCYISISQLQPFSKALSTVSLTSGGGALINSQSNINQSSCVKAYQYFKWSNLQRPSFVRNIFLVSIFFACGLRCLFMIVATLYVTPDADTPFEFLIHNLPSVFYFTVFSLLTTYLYQLYNIFQNDQHQTVDTTPISSSGSQNASSLSRNLQQNSNNGNDQNASRFPITNYFRMNNKQCNQYFHWSLFIVINPLALLAFIVTVDGYNHTSMVNFFLFFITIKSILLLFLIYSGSLIYNYIAAGSAETKQVASHLLWLLGFSCSSLILSILFDILRDIDAYERDIEPWVSTYQLGFYLCSEILPISGILYFISKRKKTIAVTTASTTTGTISPLSSAANIAAAQESNRLLGVGYRSFGRNGYQSVAQEDV